MSGKLIIVPTPIGNLEDITLRAIDALAIADGICAEDTRRTGILLYDLGITGKRLIRLDEYVMKYRLHGMIDLMKEGKTFAFCSDAGMPGVSDPGQRLIDAAYEAGVPVEVLPGPSAVTTAYVASGTAATSFYFGAFFPRKAQERRQLLESLKPLDAALVFYESPHRLVSALASIAEVLPMRKVAVCRELTKVYEEVVRGPVDEVKAEFESRESVKGEIAIVIDGPNDAEREADAASAAVDAEQRIAELLSQGERAKTVAKLIAEEFGIPRNAAYDMVMSKRGDSPIGHQAE